VIEFRSHWISSPKSVVDLLCGPRMHSLSSVLNRATACAATTLSAARPLGILASGVVTAYPSLLSSHCHPVLISVCLASFAGCTPQTSNASDIISTSTDQDEGRPGTNATSQLRGLATVAMAVVLLAYLDKKTTATTLLENNPQAKRTAQRAFMRRASTRTGHNREPRCGMEQTLRASSAAQRRNGVSRAP
jgi:hypothetical protein